MDKVRAKSFGRCDRCPECGSLLSAAADVPFGETHCPRCMVDLWFVNFPGAGTRFVVRGGRTLAEEIAAMVGPGEGGVGREWAAVFADPGMADSLDWVELLMELEAALPALAE